MNRYDEVFDFRMATEQDIDGIMQFIRGNWDANHILGNNRDFFEYHYGNANKGINVFLMLNKNQKIEGMIGFVQYSKKCEKKYITISIIKVKNGLLIPLCGIELMKRFYKSMSPFMEFGCGVNPKTMLPIYDKVLKYHTGRMDQFYYLNPDIKGYKIITVSNASRENEQKKAEGIKQYDLIKLENTDNTNFDFEKKYNRLPFKDKEFIERRYFQHPVFHYIVYGIENGEKCEGLIFARKINYNAGSIILIVDFIGAIESLGHVRDALGDVLKRENVECFSLLAARFPHETLEKAGFCLLRPMQKDVIVPTYFEPFVNENIDNYYISNVEDLIIFKASGDQDNPKYQDSGERLCGISVSMKQI